MSLEKGARLFLVEALNGIDDLTLILVNDGCLLGCTLTESSPGALTVVEVA
jgi:hypothetical protein